MTLLHLIHTKDAFKLFVILIGLILTSPTQAANSLPRLLNAVYPSASEEQRCLLIDKQASSHTMAIDSKVTRAMPPLLIFFLATPSFP